MINILDAMPGSGKTTYIFKHIAENADKKWLYVSPYLSEVGGTEDDGTYSKGRIQLALPTLNFRYPTPQPSKQKHLLTLLEQGQNISITHSLFSQMPSEVIEHIVKNEYHLVIDETIDFVSLYSELSSDDIWLLLETNILTKDEDNRLHFTDKEYKRGILSETKELADSGSLYLYGSDTVIQKVDKRTIESFKSVTVLTYLFEASLMSAWMRINNIAYQPLYPDTLRSEEVLKQELRDLITIVKPAKYVLDLSKDREGAFSVNWYKQQSESTLSSVKASIENTLKKSMDKGNTFWTTFKAQKSSLEGVGYTRPKTVEIDGNILIDRSPFVPKNMRASNEYSDCTNCLYLCNIYLNPKVYNFLSNKGVELNKELYALSELIQFMYRGCVRKGLPMHLYISSTRMRTLLQTWLSS